MEKNIAKRNKNLKIKTKNRRKLKIKIKDILVFFILLTAILLLKNTSTENISNKISKMLFKSNSIVKSADIKIVDGTGPFDEDNGPGNDMDDHNNIVRANDDLIYNIQPFTELKDKNNNVYGDIIIEGKLPKERLIFWDKDAMKKWAGDAISYTEDANNFYFKYQKNYNDLIGESIGGASINFPFKVLVSGARNGTKIKPEFEVYMEGNKEEEKQKFYPEEITVSSEPRYEFHMIKLANNIKKITYKDRLGRLSDYSVYIKLKNKKDKKGLKGIEYPHGDFLGDISFKSTFDPIDEEFKGKKEDITDKYTPEIIQYKLNSNYSKDAFKIKENADFLSTLGATSLPDAYSNQKDQNRTFLNTEGKRTSGDIQIKKEEKNKYNLKFFDYLLDEKNIFPRQGMWNAINNIPETEGYISIGYMVVFTPFPDKEWQKDYIKRNTDKDIKEIPYRIELETFLKNRRYIDHQNNEQSLGEDLKLYTLNIVLIPGEYDSRILIINNRGNFLLSRGSYWYDGTSRTLEKEVRFESMYFSEASNDEEKEPYGITQITKFDSKIFEPVEPIKISYEWDNLYYLTKKDGTHWISDKEMNEANYDNFNYYDSIEEAKKHGEIVAYATQAYSNKQYFKRNIDQTLRYAFQHKMRIKDNIPEGSVGQCITDAYMYTNSYKESNEKDLKKGEFVPPTLEEGVEILRRNYIKIAYDEKGVQIAGTHAPRAALSGNSLLILKASPNISISTDKNTYNQVPEGAEIEIEAKPEINVADDVKTEEEKEVEVQITIPSDLNYISGSAKLKGKQITPTDIIKDTKGNTILTFKYNTKIDKENFMSNVIKVKAKVPTDFGESRSTKFKAIIKVDDLGVSPISDRTSEKEVYIVNLLAQVANKSLKQDVIEYGERFNYSIKFMNQSPVKYKDVTMLDILPYNGDKYGTKFNGKYYIENMKSNIGAKIYYTKDEKIREYNARNLSEANVNWIEYKEGEKLESATAIYSLSDINEKSVHDITYDIVPDDAKGGDVYGNRLLTYVKGQGDTLDTPIYKGAIAKRSITGSVWEDTNINGKIEDAEKRLENITVKLTDKDGNSVKRVNGTVVENIVTDKNGMYKFEDVPPLKDLVLSINIPGGKEITKKIADNKSGLDGKIKNVAMKTAKEMFASNYSEELANQNFGLVPKLKIIGNKQWIGGKNRPDISLQLYRKLESGEKTALGEPISLKTNQGTNKASYTWENQDITDSEGNFYEYSVDELNVPENYTKEISKDGLTIINKYNSPRITITGKKIWEGGIDRPDITITLYRTANGKKEIVEENIKLTQSGANEYTFTREVDKTDKDGNEYVYEIDEKQVPTNFVKSKVNGMTIKNTYVSPKTSVTVNKIWKGGNVRPQISVQLYRNGEKYLEPVALNTGNGNVVSYTWNDLDKTDKNGSEYVYTVDEVNVPENFVKSINANGREIVNTYVSPKIDVKATKKWVGGENVRPKKIKLGLFRTLDNVSKEKVSEAEIEVTKGAVTEYVWKMLDKTDGLGNEYTYTVSELEVPENYNKEETGLVVVNTYVSPKIDVPVTKTFVNGSLKRQAIELQLLRNGSYLDKVIFNPVAGQDNYKHIFKNLDKTDSTGTPYNYSVKEVTNLTDFTKKESGLAVVNEYVIPKTSVSFKKIWNGGFNIEEKPTYEVQLLRDGEPFLDKVVMENGEAEYTWSGLDRTDVNGKEYNYEVKEILVPKYYEEKVELKLDYEKSKHFELVNTFKMPKINILGNKIWSFGLEEKPEIKIKLKANGEEIDSLILKPGETTFKFENKDIFDEYKNVIDYDLEEEINYKDYISKHNIKYDLKYETEITKAEVLDKEKDREFKIENTFIIPKKDITVKKIWRGKKIKVPDIKIGLYKNGVLEKEIELKSGQTKYTFKDLDVTDSYGKEYEYKVDEIDVPEGYTKSVSGFTIINTKDNDRDYPFAGLSKNEVLYTAIAITSLYLVYNYKKSKKPIKKKSRYKIVNKESLKNK